MNIRTIRLLILLAMLAGLAALTALVVFFDSGRVIQVEEAGLIGFLTGAITSIVGYYFPRS